MSSLFFNYSETALPNQPHYDLGELVLNRPEKNNALNQAFIQSLMTQFDKINKNSNLAILIVRTSSNNFCTGADLNEMATMQTLSPVQDLNICQELSNFFESFRQLKPIVIAEIQGVVYGGGLGLVACSDLVISADNARFCFAETKLGLVPALISPYILSKIGFSYTKKYMISAEIFQADTAKNLQLVHDIAPISELKSRTDQWVSQISKNSIPALLQTKLLVNALGFSEWQNNPDLKNKTIQALSDARQHPETQSRIQKFLNNV